MLILSRDGESFEEEGTLAINLSSSEILGVDKSDEILEEDEVVRQTSTFHGTSNESHDQDLKVSLRKAYCSPIS